MADYQATALALRDSLLPLREYCEKQRARPDLNEYGFRHVQQLEAVRENAREFYLAAEEARSRYAESCRLNRFTHNTQKLIAANAYLLNYTPEQCRDISEYAQAFALYSHPHLTFPTITSQPC